VFARRLLTWNTGTCCGYAQRSHVDDVAFIRALLDSLERTYRIDRRRVYATGLSNGGMMSYLVACALSDRFAAVAPVSGELSMDCAPTIPVSVLIIHGTADENLPYNGGIGR
jgi:polyhydroxybutyrate depolymerase